MIEKLESILYSLVHVEVFIARQPRNAKNTFLSPIDLKQENLLHWIDIVTYSVYTALKNQPRWTSSNNKSGFSVRKKSINERFTIVKIFLIGMLTVQQTWPRILSEKVPVKRFIQWYHLFSNLNALCVSKVFAALILWN